MNKFTAFLNKELPAQKHNASFGGAFLRGFNLNYKMHKLPTLGMSANITDEANLGAYISAKRVIVGGVLFGPVGAILGAAFRKNGAKVYVVIEQDGLVIGTLEGGARDAGRAREFVAAVNASATDTANQ